VSSIIRVGLEDGSSFLAQVDDIDVNRASDKTPPPGSLASVLDGTSRSSELARETVKAAVMYIRNAFDAFNHPDEIAMEFSIALKGKGGIPVLVEQSAEATFKISAKWLNPSVVTNGDTNPAEGKDNTSK
jgi:hypothetical protein